MSCGREAHLFLAHSSHRQREGHALEAHLTATAKLAQIFANKFGAGDPGHLAAPWRDLGKFSPEFQKYIASPGPPHTA